MPNYTHTAQKINPTSTLSVQAGGVEGISLPCLYSNNGIQPDATTCEAKTQTVLQICNLLTPYHKRQAHTLFSNVQRLVTKVAPTPGHVGFLTLTFPDNLTDNKKVRERFRSFNTNYLSSHPYIREWVSTKEVQKRGAWHFHLVVVLTEDIGQDVKWEEFEEGNYRSASPILRSLWKDLRQALPSYGFGRSELMPIKSGADAIARYVGKYISKHIGSRKEEQKGVRLISYSKGWIRNGCQFAWNTKNASEWRRKLALFAQRHGCQEFYQLSAKLGPGWAYKYAQDIMEIDQVIMEEKINAKHEGREIARREYQDQTITRAKGRKAARENKMMRELVNHARVGVNLEEKRKIEIARQDIGRWLEEDKEGLNNSVIVGNVTMSGEKLIYRTGSRAGEEIF